jgi:LmbE family N-acetylglucosaminyl deacetylase
MPRVLSPLSHVASSALDALWTLGFRVAGGVSKRRARPLETSGGRRILVVAPHPDDETAAAGGTIARHVASGDHVAIAVVTDGRMSRAFGLAPDEMAARREAEARNAAHAFGADLRWIGLREGDWTVEDAVGPLTEILSSEKPDVVYAPSRLDFHPEHVRAAHSLARAVRERTADHVFRVYGVQVPLTSILVNLVADVSDESSLATLRAAIAGYPTQEGSLRAAFRPRRHAAAFHGLASAAEEFWEMSPAAYAALHSADPDPEPWRTFRGIRPSPLTDPLAHLVGRGERRLIKKRLGNP